MWTLQESSCFCITFRLISMQNKPFSFSGKQRGKSLDLCYTKLFLRTKDPWPAEGGPSAGMFHWVSGFNFAKLRESSIVTILVGPVYTLKFLGNKSNQVSPSVQSSPHSSAWSEPQITSLLGHLAPLMFDSFCDTSTVFCSSACHVLDLHLSSFIKLNFQAGTASHPVCLPLTCCAPQTGSA